jgi:hypothetical protein
MRVDLMIDQYLNVGHGPVILRDASNNKIELAVTAQIIDRKVNKRTSNSDNSSLEKSVNKGKHTSKCNVLKVNNKSIN